LVKFFLNPKTAEKAEPGFGTGGKKRKPAAAGFGAKILF
jgi:hypothetical protein